MRVDDPGCDREAEVGDAVLGLELGEVVLLDLDAARAELGELGREVGDEPARLRLFVRGPDRALRDRDRAAPPQRNVIAASFSSRISSPSSSW